MHCFYCGAKLKDPNSQRRGCGPTCAKKHGEFIGKLTPYVEPDGLQPLRDYPTDFAERSETNIAAHTFAITSYLDVEKKRNAAKSAIAGSLPTDITTWKDRNDLSDEAPVSRGVIQRMRKLYLEGKAPRPIPNIPVKLMVGERVILAARGAWYPNEKCFAFYDAETAALVMDRRDEIEANREVVSITIDGAQAIQNRTFSLKTLAEAFLKRFVGVSLPIKKSDIDGAVEGAWQKRKFKHLFQCDPSDGIHPLFFFFR